MKLANKILLSIFCVSVTVITAIATIYYSLVRNHLENSFNTRYNSLGASISNSFMEMDKLSDTINYNAVNSLFLIDKFQQIPSDKKLDSLAKKFGVYGFYVINNQGRFIRSSNLSLSLQKKSLFSYCEAYKGLLQKKSNLQVTPIIPSYPNNTPEKLIMIPNHNLTLILESGYHLKFIEEILLKTIRNNKGIISIGLYSPNNYELGYIDNKGKFEQGRHNINALTLINDEKIFKYRILANTSYCCECTVKKTQYTSGPYYYDLVMKVSTKSLVKELYQIKIKIIFALLFTLLIAFIISQIISKKIAKRLREINERMDNIIKTGDLSNSLVVTASTTASNDEIESLAASFNHMIEQLKLYQQKVRDTAVAEISSKIIHNIRSPLIVLDTIAKKLNHVLDNSNVNLLKNAIKDIKALSEKLLLTYRKNSSNDFSETENTDLTGYITISSMINEVINLKSVEWNANTLHMPVVINQDCIFSWIKVVPADFRAILSNIINNAYEALNKPNRFIKINLILENNYYTICIEDNGIGIPYNKLETVLSGESLKHKGNGLGLSGAVRYIEDTLHGKLELSSIEGVGTTVIIHIPYINPPSWFADTISITKDTKIFVLDDDRSILKYWEQRFKKLKSSAFFSLNTFDFIQNYENSKNAINKVFLIDYELSNDINGLNIIKNTLIGEKNIYLVTTHAEDPWIQNDIDSLPIYMIPKSHIIDIKILYI